MESVHPSVDAVYDQVTAHLATLDGPGLVEELRALLGARLVAYLAGVSSTSTVSSYIDDAATISDYARDRLQAAYTVAALQHKLGATPGLIQAWFQGRDPLLNDRAPARVIVDDPSYDRHTMISAAVAMVIE
ncbi:hypothetical protein SAMN04488550_0143 [Gordonia malaquae]|uniref:Uncharacterized protein n=2 Tax=Gordonia TaxID=2053 RepID=M3UN86_GORML|nr:MULTISPECIES: LacI family DNA-binding transcriptional regulator [Gordonia]GAC81535.1 hypothetical protein GM1_037_00060 [Gordonia malaquae NBRC 108250]GEE00616.1 hypothetical protein nbrc107696_10620 [Gordonia spumicola]SEB48979.1 hypothetical protein SAMN04488550_0143 [Gordonia malaquae]